MPEPMIDTVETYSTGPWLTVLVEPRIETSWFPCMPPQTRLPEPWILSKPVWLMAKSAKVGVGVTVAVAVRVAVRVAVTVPDRVEVRVAEPEGVAVLERVGLPAENEVNVGLTV